MSTARPDDRELWQRFQRARRALPARELGGLDAAELAAYAEDPTRLGGPERVALERKLLADDDALEAIEQLRRSARTPPAVVGGDVVARAQARLERELGAASLRARLALVGRAPIARRLGAAAVLVAVGAAGFASGRLGAPPADKVPVAALPSPDPGTPAGGASTAPGRPVLEGGELVLLDPETLRELELDAAQRTALAALDKEARERERDLSGSIQAAQLAVACAAKDPATPPQQLRDLSLALADLQQDSDLVKEELLERFARSLRDPQRARMAELLATHPISHDLAKARFDVDRDGQLDRAEREKLYAEMHRRIEQRKKAMQLHGRHGGSGSDRPIPPWRQR